MSEVRGPEAGGSKSRIPDPDVRTSDYGTDNEPGPVITADEKVDAGQIHFQNFIDTMRSPKVESLHAPLEEGHLSTSLCHLGNIAYRVGRSVKFDSATERFVGDSEADALLGRTYRAPHALPDRT